MSTFRASTIHETKSTAFLTISMFGISIFGFTLRMFCVTPFVGRVLLRRAFTYYGLSNFQFQHISIVGFYIPEFPRIPSGPGSTAALQLARCLFAPAYIHTAGIVVQLIRWQRGA